MQAIKNNRIKSAIEIKRKGKNTEENRFCAAEFSERFTFLASFLKKGVKACSLKLLPIGKTISSNIAVNSVIAGYCKIVKKVTNTSLKEVF